MGISLEDSLFCESLGVQVWVGSRKLGTSHLVENTCSQFRILKAHTGPT